MEITDYCKKGLGIGIMIILMPICTAAAVEGTVGESAGEAVRAEETGQLGISPAADLPPVIAAQSVPIAAKPGNQAAALGKTVTEVTVDGGKNVPTDNLIPLFRVKQGMTLFEDGVSQDLQMIYETGWFYDVQAEYSLVPEGVRVSYKVSENPVLDKTIITGSSIYSDNLLKRLLGLETGQVINSKRLSEGMRAIETAYNRDGYILARVINIDMQPDGVLGININEGIIEGFSIVGNKKTKDRVILRELRLYKGEPFNVNDGRRSMQRVFNLGFFEDVNIKLNPGRTPNGVEVEVTVVEMPTGTFGIGAGYSEADGLVGMIMLGDKNLRGTGDSINVRWEFGGVDNKNYDLAYRHPWLDRHGTTLGFNIYDVTHEYEELDDDGHEKAYYDRKRKGMEFYLSRPVNDYITDSVTFKFRDDIYVRPVPGEEPQYYEMFPGEKAGSFGKTHSIVLSRMIDKRDNIHNPTRGQFAQFSGEFAGIIGGDFDFNKYTVEGRAYFPAGRGNVWAFRAAVGYATGVMPISQRFSLGGDSYLRGYKDDRFYGYKMLSGTAEYRFPIAKNFQGVAFSDVGYAWDKGDAINLNDVEYGYGVGLRINSPLGPIRLDYAHGDRWRLHFSFSTQF
ncbi:MAG: BamA/TamA family outer membrane protein [Acidaminococcales bacterium]|jgi:outer membrane protein insertion porin family|nr:BamA/TamA family outer membrane protein [Acidaminococcales bacterium]